MRRQCPDGLDDDNQVDGCHAEMPVSVRTRTFKKNFLRFTNRLPRNTPIIGSSILKTNALNRTVYNIPDSFQPTPAHRPFVQIQISSLLVEVKQYQI